MISLGMIVKNAEDSLARCLDSVAPYVDEIVIGLGGESTDQTEAIARSYVEKKGSGEVFQIDWHDDFSEARNLVLDRVHGDYFLWLDGDDELVGGENLKDLIHRFPQVDAFYWGYEYSRDETGATTCYLVRERLIKLSPEWRWLGAIHEVLHGPSDHLKMHIDNIVVKHYPHNDEPFRNLQILYSQLEASEPNPDPRILMYLGTENASRGNFTEAIVHLNRYLPLSGWDDERYQAQHRIADIYRAMGNYRKAREADFAAIQIRPEWADAYLGLAETAYHEQKFLETVEWSKTASTKKTPESFLIINPRDYDFTPLMILGLAYAQLNDYEMAVANFRKALEIVPDPKVLHNLRAVEEELEGHKLVDAFQTVWEHLCKNDEWLKARKLFDAVPKLIEKTPPINQSRSFTFEATAHVENPELMIEDYRSNPHWVPMSDEQVFSDGWLEYPRLKFAQKVLRSIGARSVIDLGCSDGFITIPLGIQNPGVKFTGIDLDPRCISLATKRTNERELKNLTFTEGDLQNYKNGHKADLAIMFEVIEHVVDPVESLAKVEKLAKHIALTTPHLAWISPAPGWNEPGYKGHLRIFDLLDMEALLSSRGRIHNLYEHKVSEGSSWIFADYSPGESTNGHVTILAPGTPEAWSPLTFDREGLGGSETAVIKLSEALAGLNYQVSVFSRIANEGYFNRVRYRDQSRYVSDIRSEVFIAWRAPELIDFAPNAAHPILWMHDTDAGDRLTADRASKFESIVVLTEWHKNYMLQRYPFLEPEKLVVIPNGVDATLFENTVTRNPKKVIYSSSPDRGLDYILEFVWPKVVERDPEAELHIYYGWNNFDKFLTMFPQMQEFKNKVMNLLSSAKNVVQHGRISQKRLAQEMMSGGVWLYPTSFSETYCITAIEAQLAGLIPVTNDLAALRETVVDGIVLKLDQYPLESPDTAVEYANATLAAFLIGESARIEIKKSTPFHSWDEVAKEWANRWLESGSSTQHLDLPSIPSSTSRAMTVH